MATNAEKYERAMMEAWNNPPKPFNPNYNQKRVDRDKEMEEKIRKYSSLLDSKEEELTDAEFLYMYNAFSKNEYLKFLKEFNKEEEIETYLKRRLKVSLEKYKINKKDILFVNKTRDGEYHKQDIKLKNKIIGYLEESENGMFEDITRHYIIFVKGELLQYLKDNEEIEIQESEDKGIYRVKTKRFDDFLDIYFFEKKRNKEYKDKKNNKAIQQKTILK